MQFKNSYVILVYSEQFFSAPMNLYKMEISVKRKIDFIQQKFSFQEVLLLCSLETFLWTLLSFSLVLKVIERQQDVFKVYV